MVCSGVRVWIGCGAAAAVLGLAGCGGGAGSGGGTSGADLNALPSASAELVATSGAVVATSSYTRQIWVNPAHPSSSDLGEGTFDRPLRSISRAMSLLQPGFEVIIGPGIYYEPILIPPLPAGGAATMIRAQYADGSTVIRGSVPVTGWIADSSSGLTHVWSIAWSGTEPQQVFRQGVSMVALKQVGGTVYGGFPETVPGELRALGNIWPGRLSGDKTSMPVDSFFYSSTERRLYVRLAQQPSSAGHTLFVSVLPRLLDASSANRLTVRGIVFEHSNVTSLYRQGAVKLGGVGNTLQNITARYMDGHCVELNGTDNKLLNSLIHYCGHVGVHGHGRRLQISGNTVTHNNTRGFDKWWEAGGMKFIGETHTHDSVVSNNLVAYNYGDGIWFDTKNRNNLIENNTLAYNEGFGVHYEASYTGTIRGNRVYGNSMRGIHLLESANSLIEDNVVFSHPYEGVVIADGDRSEDDPTLKPANNIVRNNTIAWNDHSRNWVQLILAPGLQGNQSDRNVFVAQDIKPRMNLGYHSGSNPASETLTHWQARSGQDMNSLTSLQGVPSPLAAKLAARQLLETSDLPVFLQQSGVR